MSIWHLALGIWLRPQMRSPDFLGVLCGFPSRPLRLKCFLTHTSEQVGLRREVSSFCGSRQVEYFSPAALSQVLFEHRPKRSLANMRPEGLNLGFQVVANLDGRCDRSQSDRFSSRKKEVGGGVVKLLRTIGSDGVAELVGKAIAPPCPMESQRGKD